TALRESQTKEGKPPGYDSCCRDLVKEDIEKKEKEGQESVIRFKIPESPKEIAWDDVVRGKVSIRTDIQEDFVIMKSDGYPTYNFANVIDDHDMEITNVIRGEEFIPSTPKHISLYMALCWEPPTFSHLPVIIGADKKKLSKRHGDTAIMDYKDNGYLADTMLNFLTLLGWNDGTTQEIFTREELIKKFDLKRVGKSPAVFDIERLNWINGEKIRAMKIPDLTKEVEKFNPEFLQGKESELIERSLTVMQTRMVTLKDFTENADYFFKDIDYSAKTLIFGKSTKESTLKGLKGALKTTDGVNDIDSPDDASRLLKVAVESEGLSNGDVFWPVRVALSGQEKSPSPNEIMWALRKDETLKRIKDAINKVESL
ncbi:MAG: glutamate--tRNA ligase, partial [Patescibacteria group bacterium]